MRTIRNEKVHFELDGWSFSKDDYENDKRDAMVSDYLQINLVVNKETYYALHYLLQYAAEKHDNYQQVRDAVYLADQIQVLWEDVRSDIESQLNQE